MLHFGRKQAYSPFSATISVRKFSNLNRLSHFPYIYECFICLKFVTETDIYLCSNDNTVVYAKPGRIGDLVRVACVWLYINSKNT